VLIHGGVNVCTQLAHAHEFHVTLGGPEGGALRVCARLCLDELEKHLFAFVVLGVHKCQGHKVVIGRLHDKGTKSDPRQCLDVTLVAPCTCVEHIGRELTIETT
jgi:hypothetical protein